VAEKGTILKLDRIVFLVPRDFSMSLPAFLLRTVE